MKRLWAALACDVRLQFRNGFYYAAAFVVVVLAVLLRTLPAMNWSLFLPAIVLSNMLINPFYFIGGQMLLEKDEGTLVAQVVTPLRSWEYLASKIITLAGLAFAENFAIVTAAYGLSLAIVPFALGVALTTALFGLYGYLVVSRYDSINEYLFPSFGYTVLLLLPLIDFFGLWRSWLFYLHPVQGLLLLLRSAFEPIAAWQWVYALLYAGLWIAWLTLVSSRSFTRFAVKAAGAA